MIRSFRHKGLERLYGRGDRRGVPVELAGKVSRILNVMNTAEKFPNLDCSLDGVCIACAAV